MMNEPRQSWLSKVLVGRHKHEIVSLATEKQWQIIIKVWENRARATFGIERLFRLFLAFSAYLFPGMYIREVAGTHGRISRKLALDAYVLFKVFVPIVILCLGTHESLLSQVLVFYLGVETLLYVAGLMFLSDIYTAPISYQRSYLLFLMNYVEICLDFAVLYAGFGLVKCAESPLDAAYFSFMTGFTVGYGDMTPDTPAGKLLSIVQSGCALFFITLALAKVVSSFDKNHSKGAD